MSGPDRPLLALAESEPLEATADPWLLVGALACLTLAALGSLTSVALLIYSPTKLAIRLGHDNGDRASPMPSDRDRSHYAVSVCVTILGLGAAVLLTWIGAHDPLVRAIALSVLTGLAILGCGLLPARIAELRAESIVARAKLPLTALTWLTWPLRPLGTLAQWTLRLLRIPDTPPSEPAEIKAEILAAVEDSVQDCELDQDERGWMLNIVALRDRSADEVMTPRTDIVAFDRTTPVLEAVERATVAGHSRYPVYDGKVDDVVGVFYVKDALTLLGDAERKPTETVGDLMRKPLFVPEGRKIVPLLQEFRASKVQMAILLDEYGGTAGIVSIEDILEEIVGEISDEHDLHEEATIRVIEEGRVVEATGRARVDEVNEHLGVQLPEGDDYDTVAGYVFHKLDRIPKVDERIELDSIEVRILRADDRRISRMRLTLLAPSAANGAQHDASATGS